MTPDTDRHGNLRCRHRVRPLVRGPRSRFLLSAIGAVAWVDGADVAQNGRRDDFPNLAEMLCGERDYDAAHAAIEAMTEGLRQRDRLQAERDALADQVSGLRLIIDGGPDRVGMDEAWRRAEAERDRYRAVLQRAHNRLSKYDIKGPKQVDRAMLVIEAALRDG
jgi:hypothetical protein